MHTQLQYALERSADGDGDQAEGWPRERWTHVPCPYALSLIHIYIAERSEEDDAPGEERPGASGHDRNDNRGDGERAYEGRDIVPPGGEAVA